MRKYPLQAILQFDDPQSGNAAANVEFNVYNSGGGLATIYANDGANPISQTSPLVTDSNGRYDFYVENGRYSILFTDQVVAAQNDVLDIGIYEYGSAGARDVATTAEAIAGTSNKLPDTIGVSAFVDAELSKRARGKVGKLLVDGDSTLLDSGDYHWNPAQGSVNHPDGKIGEWHVSHSRRAVGGGETQVWAPENAVSGKRFYRTRVVDTWSAPVYIYDSDNTNFNEFGFSNGKVLATGVCPSPNLIRIALPLAGKSTPASITVTGTFIIKANNTTIATGVTGSELLLKDYSGTRLGVVEYSATGLVQNSYVELITETDSSKITVNY